MRRTARPNAAQAGERCALNLAGDGITKEAIARGDVVLDPELHAPTDRIDATLAGARRASRSRSRNGCRCGCIMRRATSRRASCCSATPIAPGARRRLSSSCWSGRSRRRRTTASCCATPRRSAPSRAAASSICARRRASAARRSGSRSSKRMRSTTRRPRSRALLDRAPWYVDLAAFARDRALAASEIDAMAARRYGDPHRGRGARPVAGRLAAAQARAARRRSRPSTRTIPISPASGSSGCACSSSRAFRRRRSRRCCNRSRARTRLRSTAPGCGCRATRCGSRRPTRSSGRGSGRCSARPSASARRACATSRALIGEPEADIRRLLKLLGRMGKVDEVAPDHFFLRDTVAEMVEIARRRRGAGRQGAVHRGAVPRPARQRPQGRDPDPGILRPPRRDLAARRPAPHEPAAPRPVSAARPKTAPTSGREASPVGRPDFKSGRGREPVLGGFDSLSLPPRSRIEPDR